jgi:hypothetical protein
MRFGRDTRRGQEGWSADGGAPITVMPGLVACPIPFVAGSGMAALYQVALERARAMTRRSRRERAAAVCWN